MARRRRVGNLLALAVLSTVMERPMHPYEMASTLREREKHQDMEIKWGSLYTVVRNLTKHGLIEPTKTVREGGRPERTVYRITDAGREEFDDWVRELISTPEREHPRFKAGLSMLGALAPSDAAALLERRLAELEQQLAGQRDALARNRHEVPRLYLVEDEYDLAIREAEATWIRALVDELMDGSFPDIARWRAVHQAQEEDA